MSYNTSGNFEAFATPKDIEGIHSKKVYLVGGGLASLTSAAFLVRDAKMPGKNITILEALDVVGGACDGRKIKDEGFVIRGGREMENHYECLWDLFRSIPSLETKGVSVLDEFRWLNIEDPNFTYVRAIQNRGEDCKVGMTFTLTRKAQDELLHLYMAREEDLEYKKISDVFSKDFFASNFWMYWRTMFAFETWHSALEMHRYLLRFTHHLHGMPDFSVIKFTRYNQYESLIQPLEAYLKEAGVKIQYNTMVNNVVFDINGKTKTAKSIQCTVAGKPHEIALGVNDYVFITNGSCTENSSLGNQDRPALLNTGNAPIWEMWKNIAKQDPSFGNPDVFCSDIGRTNWESATILSLDNRLPELVEKICHRNAFTGKTVTGGIITIKDSNWLISWSTGRQPHFKHQPKGSLEIWFYGLFTNTPGNYIKKCLKDCTGIEIAQELLYHLGVPTDEILDFATNSMHTIPCMMPYITSFFMPRKNSDRPKVVPDGSTNFAFIGQFAEIPKDCIFTIEYSTRSSMEAVYTLFNVDRGIPEVFGSCYDIRCWMNATSTLIEGKKLLDLKLSWKQKLALKVIFKKLKNTYIEELLEDNKLI